MNVQALTDNGLRALMDECRMEYARRVRRSLCDGTLPVPTLVMRGDRVSLYKSIQAYREAHPELDMLTCTEAVKAEAGIP